MFDLEKSISEWRQRMLAAGIKTPVPLEELEIHLREAIEQQMKSGLNEVEAFKTAVQKIGQAHAVQNEFKKVEAARDVIAIVVITLGIVLMLVGIPFVMGLGFALMLFVVVYGLQQQGRRGLALSLFLLWATSRVLNLIWLLQKDGTSDTLVYAFDRKPLPLWYRVPFVCMWLVCIISHFWQRRKNKSLA